MPAPDATPNDHPNPPASSPLTTTPDPHDEDSVVAGAPNAGGEGSVVAGAPNAGGEGSVARETPDATDEGSVVDEVADAADEGSVGGETPAATDEGSVVDEVADAADEGSVGGEVSDVGGEGSVGGEVADVGDEGSVGGEVADVGGEGLVVDEVAEVGGEGSAGDEAPDGRSEWSDGGQVAGAGDESVVTDEVPDGRDEALVAGGGADSRPDGIVGGDEASHASDGGSIVDEVADGRGEVGGGGAGGGEVGGGGVGRAEGQPEEGFRSGFVTLVGRPNVGKSTLLNQILGQKVTIVSDKPQTTRHRIQGVLNRPGAQIVFVDTPGLHKPRTTLGERLNDTARATISDVDAVVFVLDATQPFGRGDSWVAERLPKNAVVAVNKTDIAKPDQILAQLAKAGELEMSAYFPISAVKGKGVAELVDHLLSLMPEGPQYFPDDMISDVPEAFWVAELVREQLLAVAREELPHSIATRVTEWEWPYIRCEIVVERDSQKGIVVGKGGDLLKRVGTAVRSQLPPGAYLDLHVTVDKNWQRRPAALDRLGF